jgi:FkbM family methyltransferase
MVMDPLQRRGRLMRNHAVSLVLDVGANKGQFGRELRRGLGYQGRIVSFEPLSDAFAELQRATSADGQWACHNFALGARNGTATIHVSANSHSSSLLLASPRSLEIEPSIAPVRTEEIAVRRLDDLLDALAGPEERIYLKVDTQGYELEVLRGSLAVINRFALIQLETSFYPVYQREALVGDVIKFMDCLGFRVVSLEPGWEDPKTGELLQADLIFGQA